MSRGRLARLWAAGLLAVATGLFSLLGVIALNAGGRAQAGPVVLLRLAAGADRRAEPLLARPGLPPAADRREAVALSRDAISQYPYDTAALLRLAYVDELDHGRLSPEGLGYLRRSYDLVPCDPVMGLWRIRFALENFSALTPDLRKSVAGEVRTMWGSPRKREGDLRTVAAQLRDPVGRIMLFLWLYRLEHGQAIE